MEHLTYISVILMLVTICLIQLKKIKDHNSIKGKRRGILRFGVWNGPKAYNVEDSKRFTTVSVEVVELERFENGYSKIKILNISGTRDCEQYRFVKKRFENLKPTDEINWFDEKPEED